MTTLAEITNKLNAEIDALTELAEREAARAEWHDADRWHNQSLGLINAREIIAAIPADAVLVTPESLARALHGALHAGPSGRGCDPAYRHGKDATAIFAAIAAETKAS